MMISEPLLAQGVDRLSRVKFSPARRNNQKTVPLFQHRGPLRRNQRQLHFVPHDFRPECGGPGYLQCLAHGSGKNHAPKFIHGNNGLHFPQYAICHAKWQNRISHLSRFFQIGAAGGLTFRGQSTKFTQRPAREAVCLMRNRRRLLVTTRSELKSRAVPHHQAGCAAK